ncbi:hypothetical protein L218DRAFT_62433 [Marasmius fiardii PR-910]|nr:hypothetical protein L218DRAFT_62433 [Marasmius fiardii PR-910]
MSGNEQGQSPSGSLHKLEKNQKAEEVVDSSPNPKITEPTLQESWDAIIKTIDNRGDDLVKGHKEDLDTLLVYAGLFSAVVTAFTIESFKWLQEDPADSTVVLLAQIAQQLSGQPPSVTSPPKPLAPSSSLVRMNTFWTTSLILALVDALFALLCKQWLREHQRPMNTRTPGQALALRWLRIQSFKWWHVPTILASLPILLEFALFFFFAGLLELSWATHHISFAIALSIVGLAVLFYVVTTVLPGISMIRQVLQIHPSVTSGTIHPYNANVIDHLPPLHSICPYKSPQSWLIFRLFSATYHIPGCRRFLHSRMGRLWKDGPEFSVEDFNDNINKNILLLNNWSSHDLKVIQRFSELPDHPDIYELKGFQWLVGETRDVPSTRPHLKNILRELPPHLVMPSIFDRWVLPEWGSWRETGWAAFSRIVWRSNVSP